MSVLVDNFGQKVKEMNCREAHFKLTNFVTWKAEGPMANCWSFGKLTLLLYVVSGVHRTHWGSDCFCWDIWAARSIRTFVYSLCCVCCELFVPYLQCLCLHQLEPQQTLHCIDRPLLSTLWWLAHVSRQIQLGIVVFLCYIQLRVCVPSLEEIVYVKYHKMHKCSNIVLQCKRPPPNCIGMQG